MPVDLFQICLSHLGDSAAFLQGYGSGKDCPVPCFLLQTWSRVSAPPGWCFLSRLLGRLALCEASVCTVSNCLLAETMLPAFNMPCGLYFISISVNCRGILCRYSSVATINNLWPLFVMNSNEFSPLEMYWFPRSVFIILRKVNKMT